MTDQEQVEKWRAEFIELQRTKRDTSFFDGRFLDDRTEILFIGFCIAKRAQKPVELPKPEMCFTSSPNGHGSFAYVHLDPLIESLESAGVPYTVKGE